MNVLFTIYFPDWHEAVIIQIFRYVHLDTNISPPSAKPSTGKVLITNAVHEHVFGLTFLLRVSGQLSHENVVAIRSQLKAGDNILTKKCL